MREKGEKEGKMGEKEEGVAARALFNKRVRRRIGNTRTQCHKKPAAVTTTQPQPAAGVVIGHTAQQAKPGSMPDPGGRVHSQRLAGAVSQPAALQCHGSLVAGVA